MLAEDLPVLEGTLILIIQQQHGLFEPWHPHEAPRGYDEHGGGGLR